MHLKLYFILFWYQLNYERLTNIELIFKLNNFYFFSTYWNVTEEINTNYLKLFKDSDGRRTSILYPIRIGIIQYSETKVGILSASP